MQRSPSLQAALDAATEAGDIISHYYHGGAPVQVKRDGSPVTQADIEAEAAIRHHLLGRFPQDGFLGEESGTQPGQSGRIWIVDPLDGTRSFVRGYPFFSTQIALMVRGELVLGVSSAPWMGELAYAERGAGAWLNDAPVHVSDVTTLEAATVSVGNVGSMARDHRWQGLGKIAASVGRFRGYGDFYHYHLLAAGRLEAVVESDINVYDIAALAAIVTEAGGTVTALGGGGITLESTSILASNGVLHPTLQSLLT